MKRGLLVVLVLMFTVAAGACRQSATPIASPEALPVEDQTSLVNALKAAGVTVEAGEPVTQEFFGVEGQTIKVNGMDLQIFEYETAEAMEKDAAQVAPDGGSIGTSMVMWMDTPHFYKIGRMIVLYLGNDQAILNTLNKVIGPQFAGR